MSHPRGLPNEEFRLIEGMIDFTPRTMTELAGAHHPFNGSQSATYMANKIIAAANEGLYHVVMHLTGSQRTYLERAGFGVVEFQWGQFLVSWKIR